VWSQTKECLLLSSV